MGRIVGFARRFAAYFTDGLVILVYAGLLAAVSMTLLPDAQLSRLHGYGLALVTLTGPVVLVFSLVEARFGATPGKWLWGLRVKRGGSPAPFALALVRNFLKFLPWELAHMGIWLTPGQPFIDAPEGVSFVLISLSYLILIIQAVLVLTVRRGAHDWVSGLSVVRR